MRKKEIEKNIKKNIFSWFYNNKNPLTICGNPIVSINRLQPYFFTMCGNNILPMMAPMNVIDITIVASLRDNGPLGNIVSGFWSSTKLTEAQPSVDPYDTVNRFTENIIRRCWKTHLIPAKKYILTANRWEKLSSDWPTSSHWKFEKKTKNKK